MTQYEQLPTSSYPPVRVSSTHRCRPRPVLLIAAGLSVVLLLGAIPSALRHRAQTSASPASDAAEHDIQSTPTSSSLYRDTRPLRTIEGFWGQAEAEIRERNLDTCDDKLGRSLIDAYVRTKVDYCRGAQGGSNITCVSVQADPVSEWWPVPEAPCLSQGLHAQGKTLSMVNANITAEGRAFASTLGHEKFAGTNLGEAEFCEGQLDRTVMLICKSCVLECALMLARQDQWNPFHVGEDMVTTLVTALVATRLEPSLIDTRVQLVFSDDYGIEANHFVSMWDRMGAWAPRRLSLDPWENECRECCFASRLIQVGRTIHSIGAGVSLLSAHGVDRS